MSASLPASSQPDTMTHNENPNRHTTTTSPFVSPNPARFRTPHKPFAPQPFRRHGTDLSAPSPLINSQDLIERVCQSFPKKFDFRLINQSSRVRKLMLRKRVAPALLNCPQCSRARVVSTCGSDSPRARLLELKVKR